MFDWSSENKYYIVPHAPIPLAQIRPLDIFILLILGCVWELLSRFILRQVVMKSTKLIQQEIELQQLSVLIKQKRALGPSAFVETSRLERQLLALQKELEMTMEQRKLTYQKYQQSIKKCSYVINTIIFLIYYGIPILSMDGTKVLAAQQPFDYIVTDEEDAFHASRTYLNALLFPIGYLGIGIKLSRIGLHTPRSSIGALLVFWSSQVMVSQLVDGYDALLGINTSTK